VAEEFFQRQGVNAEIIKLSGATELAPSVGLAEMVVDIVSTGRTLAENNLVIVEEICDSTARLIANQVSFRLKSGRIKEITGSLQAAVEKGGK
jgi:ATP phosphoribosyltransferase